MATKKHELIKITDRSIAAGKPWWTGDCEACDTRFLGKSEREIKQAFKRIHKNKR